MPFLQLFVTYSAFYYHFWPINLSKFMTQLLEVCPFPFLLSFLTNTYEKSKKRGKIVEPNYPDE